MQSLARYPIESRTKPKVTAVSRRVVGVNDLEFKLAESKANEMNKPERQTQNPKRHTEMNGI